jgi:hypothetical protein
LVTNKIDKISFKAWHKKERRWADHNELLSEIPVSATVREPSILTVGSEDWELYLVEEVEEK